MIDEDFIPGEEEQDVLFEAEPDWKEDHWQGMPDYSHQDMQPEHTLLVHFRSKRDREEFAKRVGQRLHSRTKFIWYPEAVIGTAADKVYTSEKVTPRYPIYIISKGRSDTRLTSKAFEWAKVPYHICVEPQEYAAYAAVIDPAKILTLPFSNLGLGGIPARNFVWEHAVATGAKRHWIFDDNVSGFCRFQDNLKVEVDSGVLHCAIEDWVDRYENVALAGFNYDYFAPRKQGAKIKPITLNTRIYSGILIDNRLTHRWRGRYNEDTDLSLRILKDGYCTALFNAFLMYKKPTLTMKGGNTDELYAGVEQATKEWEEHAQGCDACKQCLDGYGSKVTPCDTGRVMLSKDGRWLMAESLRAQHPDCTTVERKWRRWQHQVDYRAFEPTYERNVLKLRPDADVSAKYDLSLDIMPADEPSARGAGGHGAPLARPRPDSVSPKPTVSALAFVQAIQPVPEARPARIEKSSPVVQEPDQASPPTVSDDSPPDSLAGQADRDQARFHEAVAYRDALAARGHRLLTRDGKFFVSESSRLSEYDRMVIKMLRDEFVALAESWIEPTTIDDIEPTAALETTSLFDEPRSGQTLAQFLGTEPIRVDANYVPDDPPDLTGIDDVILNFATTGLDWAGVDRPCGVTVSTLDGKMTRFLPFSFKYGGNLDEEAVKRWAREQLQGKRILNARTKFDVHMSRAWGIDLEAQGCTFSDIQHTAALLDDHRKKFALDALCADYFPNEPFVGRVDESRHAEHHAAEVAERELFTARLVSRLRERMYPEIDKQELHAVQALEDRVIPAVVMMEANGAPIDEELLARYGRECTAKHHQLLMEVSSEAGFAFDHTAKAWQRLFESLGLPPTDGNSEAVIGHIEHPLVKKAHLAAQYASLNSKIFNAYPKLIRDGIMRYDINQLRGENGGTVTGRFSASPIQQCPNHDNHNTVFGEDLFPRRLYIPGSGKYLAADAAQIQYRIFASHAANPRILKMYAEDPKASFHRMIEGMIRPYKQDLVYSHIKNMNFMRIFGGGIIKLAVMMSFITDAIGEEIRRNKGQKTDPRLAQAREIDAIYQREIPEVEPLLRKASHLAMTQCNEWCRKNDQLHRELPHRGYVKTVLGRRSRFPDDYRLHKAFCMVDQGSEGDILKEKIAQLHEARHQTGFVMRMTVHDEVSGDATEPETLQKVDAILNTQSFPQLKVPILFECKEGANWAEAK